MRTFPNPSPRRGFSLIEILVAMAILVVIVLIVAGVFQQTSLAWSLGLRRATEQGNVRAVAGAIGRDLSMIVDPANLAIGPAAADASLQQRALEAGLPEPTESLASNTALTFWALMAPDLWDEEQDKVARELALVKYEAGSGSVTRTVTTFDDAGSPTDTESVFKLGTGRIEFETIPGVAAEDFTSAYSGDGDAAGIRVVVTPAGALSVNDYEIYVGSAGPDGEWDTDDDIRPWVEGEEK